MKKRKWLLLIIILMIGIVWHILFYKTYSNKTIAKSADVVLSIDVKRNTNTLLAYFLTTPSEWKIGSVFHLKKDTTFDWKDAIKIPDYIFIFHSKAQPASVWYCVLDIKDESRFQQGAITYRCKETTDENGLIEYSSGKLGLTIIKNGTQILISNTAANNQDYIKSVANELFIKKGYFDVATLKKIIAPANHFSIYLQKGDFLREDAILNGNFTNGKLQIDGSLLPQQQFLFIEDTFTIPTQSLLALAFTQPSPNVYAGIPTVTKSSMSTALNFDIDSLFVPQNKKYTLDIAAIITKEDSAITYSYDADFNETKKTTVNKIQEPSFCFTAFGENTAGILHYWIKNKNIEATDTTFVSIPFVKTYAGNHGNSLSLTAYNYNKTIATKQLKCIAYLNSKPNKMPVSLLHYFPGNSPEMLANIESVDFIAEKDNAAIAIDFSILNKNKSKPFLLSFK